MASAMESNRISSPSGCQEVWKEYKQTQALELRNWLVEFYLPLVKYNAKRIKARLPETIELDDLVSAGVFGLMDAIKAFDLSRGVKFETYCVPRIQGAVLDEIRRMDWAPRLVRSQVSKYKRVKNTLCCYNGNGNGRVPTVKEIAECLGISIEDAKEIESVGSASVARFFRIVKISRGEDGQEEFKLHSGVVDSNSLADHKSLCPEDELSKDAGFYELISCLSDIEQVIVTLYHRDDYEMWKIGAILSLSESRVSQIHSKALQKIKDSIVL